MINPQKDNGTPTGLVYAYCHCGVVGPLRRSWYAAVIDETDHAAICSAARAVA